MPTFRALEFMSDATEFHVILWNLNYGNDAVKDGIEEDDKTAQFTNGFTKEYRNAQRQIYRLVLNNPKTTIKEMAEKWEYYIHFYYIWNETVSFQIFFAVLDVDTLGSPCSLSSH